MYDLNHAFLKENNLNFVTFLELQSLGLITLSSGYAINEQDENDKELNVDLNYYNHNISFKAQREYTLNIGQVLLTDTGKELFKLT